MKEFMSRVKKIWNSELNGLSKLRAYRNAFAVFVVTLTVMIINRTKKEISDLDVMNVRC